MAEANFQCQSSSNLCLGLPGWTACCPFDSAESDKENSSEGKTSKKARFEHSVSDDELQELSKGFIPKNTDTNTKWAVKNFTEWMKARNERCPNEPVPPDLLSCADVNLLNTWLLRFAVETRNAKGDFYPLSTIYQLLLGLLRAMRSSCPQCPNFLDEKNSSFKEFHGTLDLHFRRLHEAGIGCRVKHAEVVTKNDEDRLWEVGVLGRDTPQTLLNAVFFYNGKTSV